MTISRIYTCDVCGKKSEDKMKICACEGSHYGITGEDYDKWEDLIATRKTRLIILTGNKRDKELRAAFEHADKILADFEDAHGLTGKRELKESRKTC